MNTHKHRLLTMMVVVVVGLWLAACAPATPPPTPLDSIFSEYPTWTRLTAEPQNPSLALMSLCRLVIGNEQAYLESEHGTLFVNVFVNAAGTDTIQLDGMRVFPIGTIIVKEKLPKLDSAPTGWGVMVKREAGFNPEGNDWEYIYRDADGTTTTSATDPAPLAHCQACHVQQEAGDSVFWPRTFPEPLTP